jgi:hypothetical protein
MLGEHAVMIGAQIVPVVWSQRLHRVKTYCLSQSLPLIRLDSRYNREGQLRRSAVI